MKRSITALILAYVALLIAVMIGVGLLITRPETVGLTQVVDAGATETALSDRFDVVVRTVQALDVRATRDFDLVLTQDEAATAVFRTATREADQSRSTLDAGFIRQTAAADSVATANRAEQLTITALAATADANQVGILQNVERDATLEFRQAVLVREQTALAQDATDTARQSIETQTANEGTAVALANRESAILRQETQIAQNAQATQTQIAVVNAAQATQAAADFIGTQTAFSAQATQVEQSYRATQAALAAESTQVAQGFATQAAEGNPGDETDAPPGAPMMPDGAIIETSAESFQVTDATRWRIEADGTLTATEDDAQIITTQADYDDYVLDVTVETLDGPLLVILSLPTDESIAGVALRLEPTEDGAIAPAIVTLSTTDGTLRVVEARFTAPPITAQPSYSLRATLMDGRLQITLNEETLFITALDASAGQVGLQLSSNTRLTELSLRCGA